MAQSRFIKADTLDRNLEKSKWWPCCLTGAVTNGDDRDKDVTHLRFSAVGEVYLRDVDYDNEAGATLPHKPTVWIHA